MIAVPQRSTFANALESFISDLKRNEDIRSPFYKEVLSQFSFGTFRSDQDDQSSERLAQFVRILDEKQKHSSYTRRISERLDPLVVGLSQYTKACDVMIQAGPAAACLIYGGARIVLLLAEKFRKCFEDVLSIMESVGHLLKCYNVFAKAYEASAEMQQLLLESYKNIVSFWQKAAAIFSRKAYKTLLMGIVKPLDAEWQRCRQTLEADEKRIQLFAQATEASIRRSREVEASANQQAKLRKQIVDWIKADQDAERLDIRQDIRAHLEARHKESCRWLYEHPSMEKWLKAKKSTSIWYSAGPGAGKTILASALVRTLQDDNQRTATFFCSFNDPVRRKAVNVLRSLALQLLGPSDFIPERVKHLYEEDLKNHCSKLSDIRTATEVVELFMKQQSRIHIVVDGLDECEERDLLLHALCQLLHTKTYGIVKWFFSSRPDSDIRILMQKHSVGELVASQDSLMVDIRAYVTDRFRDNMEHNCETCIEHWTNNSEGCFLWVRHMLDILEGEGTTCSDEIEEELEEFPVGLTGCYMRSLSRLSTRPIRHQQLARSIFTMLVGAVQPLRLSELTHALTALKSSAEFSIKSLPRSELIEELCSSLVIFDRVTKGTEADPLLKVAHKSVQDFFLQDPDTLQLPHERLRKFFVTKSIASLELGLSALSYLSYGRYHTPQDIRLIMGAEEHSFLRHAATFWHYYLSEIEPSPDVSKRVLSFIRSKAFWTCIAVQSEIAPYLFARYSKVNHRGYSVSASGLKSSTSCADDVCYAVPLPAWLDAKDNVEGSKTLEAFHGFIVEWHSVLNSYPNSLDQCAMSGTWCDLLPGRVPWLDTRIRVFSLPTEEDFHLELVDVKVERSFLTATVLTSRVSYAQNRLNGENDHFAPPALVSHTTSLAHEGYCSKEIDSSSIWLVSTSGMSIEHFSRVPNRSQAERHIYSSPVAPDQWRTICKSCEHTPENGTMGRCFLAYHCMQESAVHHKSFFTESSKESGYGSMTSSDAGVDSEEEEDTDSGKGEIQQHCLLLVQDSETPKWQFWASKSDMEVKCISHPGHNVVIWSASPHQLSTMDLDSGEVHLSILPEPVDIQLSTACATRKEFRFSQSGDILYYLLYTATESALGFTHTLSLSSFIYHGTRNTFLERTQSDVSLSYETASPLQHPFMLAYWNSKFVYVALPPLSCNTKIVRIGLPNTDMNAQLRKSSIQTLYKPIYFPYSVPYCNSLFKIQNCQSSEDIIILGMNDEKVSASTGVKAKPTTVMTWKVDAQKDWRDWDESLDAREERAISHNETYKMLRGTFLDEDRRFEVTVRSGLDWRRKAFLSCA